MSTRPGTLEASIHGMAIWGPGLEGWTASQPILAGTQPYEHRESPPPAPTILAPTERRRTGPVIRLALTVATEAATQAAASGIEPATLRSVFGSSNGDGVVVGGILQALSTGPEERVVSPTQFHNSVHNAAAGYWSIATGNRQPATSLGAHDWTWAAALLKAMVEQTAENQPVLLCCYDHPLPVPLDALRPTGAAFATALVLGPPNPKLPKDCPRLRVAFHPEPAPPPKITCIPELDSLLRTNAIARALPLLTLLARNQSGTHTTDYAGGHLQIELTQ